MRVVVTFAVPSEFASLRRLSGFRRVDGAPSLYASTKQDGVYAVITGVGARDQRGIRRMFSNGVDACIVSGLAGALKPQHRVRSILVARAVKAETGSEVFRSDELLVKAASRCGAQAVDFFCTANSVVGQSSEKQRLGEIADAVDMESLEIMREAGQA